MADQEEDHNTSPGYYSIASTGNGSARGPRPVNTRHTPTIPSPLRESHRNSTASVLTVANEQEHEGTSIANGFQNRDFAQGLPDSRNSHEGVSSIQEMRRNTIDPLMWDQSSYSGDTLQGSPPAPPSPSAPAYSDTTDQESSHYPDQHNVLRRRLRKNPLTRLFRREGEKEQPKIQYVYYYIPFLRWISQYTWKYFAGDLIAAATMASFYIPMSLSYASNLAHIPAVNGMYSFAINPILYAMFGTSTQLIIGPEAAGSMLTGSVIRDSITKGRVRDQDGATLATIAGVVTGVSGSFLLLAGIFRVGFLDNVLSRSFLRGFISALGIVILVDQLIEELGLSQRASEAGEVSHGSSLEKLIFLIKNIEFTHGLTAAVSIGTFVVIMICRFTKNKLVTRFPGANYVPERFIIVVLTTIMAWKMKWEQKGVAILGDVHSGEAIFAAHNPWDLSRLKHLETALSTAFIIAMLGFFESSVAAKSLGSTPGDGIHTVARSANRELVALGLANVAGGIFMSIPAFGGYGRSKVNMATGGRTPMSNVFLALITIICIFLILPYFYYIPRGVLSAMVSVVAWSLVEEAPHDIKFFWRTRAWSELVMIFIVAVATFFYSIEAGIGCGILFSLLRVIKHASRPRIQIMGKRRGTEEWEFVEDENSDSFEYIEGCLAVRIPEPLTFANTGDLRNRLNRLMAYGAEKVHPALPPKHQSQHKNIIFDIHGVSSIDGAGALVLSDVIKTYRDSGVRIFFSRIPNKTVRQRLRSSEIEDLIGGESHFTSSVNEAVKLTEQPEPTQFERYQDDPEAA